MTREEVEAFFASLNRGDVVELTSRITVDRPGLESVCFNRPYDGVPSYWDLEDVIKYGIDLRVVSRAIPPEPPEGSVVLDRHGGAWQRGAARQWRTAQTSLHWDHLVQDYGPLRVIYLVSEPLADWEKELLEQGGGVMSAEEPNSDDRPTWHPFVICPECYEELEVPVNLTVTTHEDGSQFIDAEPDLTDVWAHAWTHEERS